MFGRVGIEADEFGDVKALAELRVPIAVALGSVAGSAPQLGSGTGVARVAAMTKCARRVVLFGAAIALLAGCGGSAVQDGQGASGAGNVGGTSSAGGSAAGSSNSAGTAGSAP